MVSVVLAKSIICTSSFLADLYSQCFHYPNYFFESQPLLPQILHRLHQTLWCPQIRPVILIRPKRQYLFSLSGQAQISFDDRKHTFLAHHGKQRGRNNVNSGERQFLHRLRRPRPLGFLTAPCPPSAKLKMLVEEQLPRTLAVLHRKGRERVIFDVVLHH